MSIYYWVDVTLDCKFKKENINKVLQDGEALDFVYCNFDQKLNVPNYNVIVSPEAATELILKENEDNIHKIYIKIDDTRPNLYCSDDNSDLNLGFDTSNFSWKKEFDNFLVIDTARYSRLLLQLSKKFFIKNFSISSDGDRPLDENSLLDIKFGTLTAAISLYEGNLNQKAEHFVWNAILSDIVFIESSENPHIISAAQIVDRILESWKKGIIAHLYADIKGCGIRILIQETRIQIEPIYNILQKTIDDENKIDLGFYVKLLLSLCEDYFISQLITTF